LVPYNLGEGVIVQLQQCCHSLPKHLAAAIGIRLLQKQTHVRFRINLHLSGGLSDMHGSQFTNGLSLGPDGRPHDVTLVECSVPGPIPVAFFGDELHPHDRFATTAAKYTLQPAHKPTTFQGWYISKSSLQRRYAMYAFKNAVYPSMRALDDFLSGAT